MRVGLLARAAPSGLGYLSQSFYDNMKPDRTVCIVGADRRYEDNEFWFPDATFVNYQSIEHSEFEAFEDIDVLFGYETFYSPWVLEAAREWGVRTVLMGMPELTRREGHRGHFGDPDLYVWPTNWLRPEDEPLLPVPVDRTPAEALFAADPIRVLHVGGTEAIGDRNGTDLFLAAIKRVKQPIQARLCLNDDREVDLRGVPKHVDVEIVRRAEQRHSMYESCDVCVLPRRYGGLSLVAQEAASYGMALIMPDCSPNRDYPAALVPATRFPHQRVPVGSVPVHQAAPGRIAQLVDVFADDPYQRGLYRNLSRDWANEHTWDALKPRYEEVLAGCLESTS